MNYKTPLLLLTIMACILSCGTHTNDYYAGIVVDELGRPIPDAILKEDFYGEIDSIHKTDNNGYFKFNMSEGALENFIVMKEGYISDTIRMVWHQYGETTEFSSIITSDSSKIELRSSKLNKDIVFTTIETSHIPDYDDTKSRFSKERLEGIWLKNGTENLNGFKFNNDDLYLYGLPGNRWIRYTIIKDKITLYKTFFYGRASETKKVIGTIIDLTSTKLTIKWTENNIITYKKLKENF